MMAQLTQRSIRRAQTQLLVKLTASILLMMAAIGGLFSSAFAQSFSCNNVTQIPTIECEALVAFYNSTDGDNWNNNDGWLQTNTPCSWYRVGCDGGHVTSLDLDQNNLNGSIPPEIGNFANLQFLDLSWSELRGSIPPELGQLNNLQELHLGHTPLRGSIPSELGNLVNLQHLALGSKDSNRLSGSIPPELGNLINLQTLSISHTLLSGNIPSELGNLINLQSLSLRDSQLSGSIPVELSNLVNLQTLHLRISKLSGSIPSELGNLVNLRNLYLHGNELSGSIPPELGNLTNLQYLRLSSNQLSGSIPSTIGNLINLQDLRLSSNQLTGNLLPEVGNLTNLQYFYLDRNYLSGSIPSEIGNLTNLQELRLELNQLSGSLPSKLGNLTNLRELYLTSNQLSGNIPPELGNLTNLQNLYLYNNRLSGNIPPELGNLTNLQLLGLLNNRLSGSIPPELGNLTNLQFLYLNENQLSGDIPPELGNLTNLQNLYLYNNQLSGNIPPELGNLMNLQRLLLRENKLRGLLPANLTHLTMLQNFWFRDTDLCIPPGSMFQNWLASIPTVESTSIICSDLILSLQTGSVINDIETFLDDHNVVYYRLFDSTRGNAALKRQLGITRTYYVEASSVKNPEVLRRKFVELSEVEDCQHNQILEFDQEASSLLSSLDLPRDFRQNLQKLEAIDAWELPREDSPVFTAILDDFRSLHYKSEPLLSADETVETFSNHGLSVASVADSKDSSLMLLNVASPEHTYAKFDKIFEAIEYVVDEKLDNPNYDGAAINISLSAPITKLGNTPDERERNTKLFQRWIKYAYLSGVPVVSSMGNFNWDVPHYPANFPETIAVGGTDRNLSRWLDLDTSFGSNFGNHLEFMAQAGDVQAPDPGTSISTAKVTKGVVSLLQLLLLASPEISAEALHEKLRWLLKITALDGVGDPIEDTPGRDPYYGWGVVDAEAAAACAENGRVLVRPDDIDFGTLKIGETASLPVMLTNCSAEEVFVIDAIRLGGEAEQNSSGEFEVLDVAEGLILESGKTSHFTMTFTPHNVGEKEALLRFSASALDGGENEQQLFEVSLHGKALSSGFTGLLSHPLMADFGDVHVENEHTLQLSLTNYQQEPITLQSATIQELDPNSGFQVFDFPTEHILASGATLSFELMFAPKTAGLKHAFLSILSQENPDTPYEIPLYGRALDPSQQSTGTSFFSPGLSDLDLFPIDPAQFTGQADSLMQEGAALYKQFDYWQAHEKFIQALKLYELAQEERGEANALSSIGMVYAGVGRIEQAIEVLLQAKDICYRLYLQQQNPEDRLQEGIILNKIGISYAKLGQNLNALRSFNEVLQIERELGYTKDEGRTLMNIGVVYLNQGWLQQAKIYFQEGQAVSQELEDIEGQAKTLANLGTVCCQENNYPDAFERYSSALNFFRQLEKTEIEEGALLLQIGDVHKAQEQYTEALQAYQEALTLFETIQYRNGEITTLKNIGDLYYKQAQYSNAITFYEDALERCRDTHNAQAEITILKQMFELYKSEDDLGQQAATLTQMGEVYNRLRRYDEALDALMQAMLIQGAIDEDRDLTGLVTESALDDEQGLSFSFLLAGEVFLRKGEYRKAIQLLDLALETQGGDHNWLDEERLHRNLAEAYLELGLYAESEQKLETLPESPYASMLRGELLAAQGERDEALSKLELALEGFETTEDYEDAGRVLLDMAELSVQEGDYSEARTSFEKALLNYRLAGELKGEAIALTRLGDLQQESEALDYYQQALDLYRSLEDREGQLDVLHRMAEIQGDQSQDAVTIGLDLARAYISRGDYEEALSALEQLDLSQATITSQAEVFLQLGISYHLKQEYQTAEGYFRQGLALFSAEAASATKADLNLKLGETLFRQALKTELPDFEEALLRYHQALALYEQLGDLRGQGTTLMRIGEIYLKQGNYEAAIESYNQAVSLLAQVDDHYNQVLAYMSLGEAYDSAGLYWDALEAYRRALGIMHDTGSFIFADYFHTSKEVRQAFQIIHSPDPLVNTADIQRHLANDYIQTEQLDEAAEALEQAAQEYELQGDDEEALESYEELQELHEEQGNTEEAIEALEETLEIQRENNDYEGQQETVEKIEESDPDYVQRTVSWLDDTDDDNRPDEEPGTSVSSSENTPETESKAREKRASPSRDAGSEASQEKAALPKVSTAAETRFEEEEAESSKSESVPLSLEERRNRAEMTTQPKEYPAELRRKAETFNNIGLVHLRQGRFQKAGSYFLSAQHIQEAIGDDNGKANTLSNRGTLHYMLGEFEEAGELYLESLALMRKLRDREGEAQVMNQLALLSYRRGQYYETQQKPYIAGHFYTEALETFREAIELSQTLKKSAIKGSLLNNQGLVYYQLMLFYRKSGAQASTQEQALTCYQRSAIMYQLALKSYQDSLEIIRDSGGRTGESATLHNIGKMYAVLELDDKALNYFWQALDLEWATSNFIDWARTLSDIGYIYERRGTRSVQEARELLKLTDFENLSAFVASWKTFITGAFTMQQALGFYQQAIEIQESLRTKARLEEFKISFAEESANVYQQSILLLMAMNSPELAFNMTERARARAFLDQVGNLRLDLHKGAPKTLVKQEQKLRSDLQRLFRQVKEEQQKSLYLQNTDKLKQQIAEKERQYEKLLTSMKLHHPQYASMVSVNTASLEDIQRQLDDETTLVSYFVTPAKTLAFSISSSSFDAIELDVSEPQLRQAVFETRRKDEPAAAYDALERLYDWLIAPLEDALSNSIIGIVPHGVLHYLPFAALKQKDLYLCDTYTLFALPSAGILRFLEREGSFESDAKTLVFGHKGFPPLKMAEEEALLVAEIHQSKALIRNEATRAAFFTRAENASLIHLSSHAKLDIHSPLFSGFLLDDNYLSLHDIYELDLSDTNLAVLSGCNTQIGERSRGDDMIALNRAFMFAGVPNVVASLWSVDDKATTELMLAFHEHLKQELSPAEALGQAQVELRERYPEPYYWASFVLTGYARNE